jgi:hypothetical protein
MPKFFADHLKGICKHCECKKEILWRNFNRTEQHFDACFRYFDEQKESGQEKQETGDPEAKKEQETHDTAEGEVNIANKPLRQNSLGKQFDEQKESGQEKQETGDPEAKKEQETHDTAEGEVNIANKPLRQNSLGKQEPQNKCFLKRL